MTTDTANAKAVRDEASSFQEAVSRSRKYIVGCVAAILRDAGHEVILSPNETHISAVDSISPGLSFHQDRHASRPFSVIVEHPFTGKAIYRANFKKPTADVDFDKIMNAVDIVLRLLKESNAQRAEARVVEAEASKMAQEFGLEDCNDYPLDFSSETKSLSIMELNRLTVEQTRRILTLLKEMGVAFK